MPSRNVLQKRMQPWFFGYLYGVRWPPAMAQMVGVITCKVESRRLDSSSRRRLSRLISLRNKRWENAHWPVDRLMNLSILSLHDGTEGQSTLGKHQNFSMFLSEMTMKNLRSTQDHGANICAHIKKLSHAQTATSLRRRLASPMYQHPFRESQF